MILPNRFKEPSWLFLLNLLTNRSSEPIQDFLLALSKEQVWKFPSKVCLSKEKLEKSVPSESCLNLLLKAGLNLLKFSSVMLILLPPRDCVSYIFVLTMSGGPNCGNLQIKILNLHINYRILKLNCFMYKFNLESQNFEIKLFDLRIESINEQ